MDNAASSYRCFLDGDEDAFDEIMRELFDPLVFFIDRFVRDTAAAEDIAIDAFSDLIVHPHRYNFKVTLKTYLFMIGRSRALNYIKRRGKVPEEELTSLTRVPQMPSPEEIFLSDQRKRAVSAAVAELPEDMRAAVHLVLLEGFSYEEAAKVMKKSKKQIDNLLYRAKKVLRVTLEEAR